MLAVERLGARDNPSVTFADGVVTVAGGDGQDFVQVYQIYGQVYVDHSGPGGWEFVAVPAAELVRIDADLGGGNDLFLNFDDAGTFSQNVLGGAGEDFLFGGAGGGLLDGGGGNDLIYAGVHDGRVLDVVGGAGSDIIVIPDLNGKDRIRSDPADVIYGHFQAGLDVFV